MSTAECLAYVQENISQVPEACQDITLWEHCVISFITSYLAEHLDALTRVRYIEGTRHVLRKSIPIGAEPEIYFYESTHHKRRISLYDKILNKLVELGQSPNEIGGELL